MGWHVPGSIVRINETLIQRVKKLIEEEIRLVSPLNDSFYNVSNEPLEVNEMIIETLPSRSHFISFLYRSILKNDIEICNNGFKETDVGYLKWFKKCPDNLLNAHKLYSKWFNQ
jgi:ADP-ribose pyrophosphatase YjhB (NUDIX family)